MKLPRWLVFTLVTLVVLSWVPLALIMRARVTTSSQPRIHIIPDMDNQPKYKTQSRNPLFADRRAMRPPVDGAVARGAVVGEQTYMSGRAGETWVVEIPVPVDEGLLATGRQRYDIYCSPCHGLAGYGDGMVAQRADALQEGTWTPPTSFHTDLIRQREAGHLFNTISNGIRNMPAYGSQIPVEDRWAIVAYMRALQRSQNATTDDVPEDIRAQLR
ncbi:MAG: cytochrome c [Acidobacteriota bacterium]|nr:cytochrome c [Acidobacteriota bacterium]